MHTHTWNIQYTSSYIMHQCFERSQSLKLKPVGHDFPEATIQDSMLDSMLQQAQLTCDHSEVRSLFLRRSEATWLHDAGHRKLDLGRGKMIQWFYFPFPCGSANKKWIIWIVSTISMPPASGIVDTSKPPLFQCPLVGRWWDLATCPKLWLFGYLATASGCISGWTRSEDVAVGRVEALPAPHEGMQCLQRNVADVKVECQQLRCQICFFFCLVAEDCTEREHVMFL